MSATAILQQQPAAVAPFPAKEAISQDELARIVALRHQVENLESELDQAEAQARAALEAGAVAEPGLLRVWLKTVERRSVAWKSVCERELGEAYCKRVLAATRPDTYTSLVIEA
jgi:hypothetical protein